MSLSVDEDVSFTIAAEGILAGEFREMQLQGEWSEVIEMVQRMRSGKRQSGRGETEWL